MSLKDERHPSNKSIDSCSGQVSKKSSRAQRELVHVVRQGVQHAGGLFGSGP